MSTLKKIEETEKSVATMDTEEIIESLDRKYIVVPLMVSSMLLLIEQYVDEYGKDEEEKRIPEIFGKTIEMLEEMKLLFNELVKRFKIANA